MTAPTTYTSVQQPSLFDGPLQQTRPVSTSGDQTIEEQFKAFHEENPHVAEALAQMALRLKRRGREHFGMKALFETLRFEYALRTDDPNSEFRLNNNYTALYARLLMRQYPELEGFFETRQRRAQ